MNLFKRSSASFLITYNELLTSQYIFTQSIFPYLCCSPADQLFIISFVSPKYFLKVLFSSPRSFPNSPQILYFPSFASVPFLFSRKDIIASLVFSLHCLFLIPCFIVFSLFYRISFVQARGYPASIISLLALSYPLKFFLKVKFIFDPRSLYFLERQYTPLNSSLNHHYENFILNRANIIFSVSQGMHHYFCTRFDPSRCYYVPLIYSAPNLKPSEPPFNFNFDSSLIICGNYLVQDCSLCLSYAVQLINQSFSTSMPLNLSIIAPDLTLFKNKYFMNIITLCNEYDVSLDSITFFSLSREQVYQAYQSAFYGIHLLPNMQDYFTRLGIKSVEMMSCSLPIIFNQFVGELRLLHDSYGCNHYVDFTSPSSTIPQDELAHLLKNRSNLSSNCKIPSDQYSSENCFPKLSTIYENI